MITHEPSPVYLAGNETVTTCLIGASSSDQILDAVKSLDNINFSSCAIEKIEAVIR